MSLSQERRNTIYRSLRTVIDDEEALGEMLSHFPARDLDAPASEAFVTAELARLEARMETRFSDIERRFSVNDGRFAEVEGRFAAIDARFAVVDGRFADLERRLSDRIHVEIRSSTRWTIGVMMSFNTLLVGVVAAVT